MKRVVHYELYLHLVVETLEDAGYKVFGTSDPCHGLLIATTGNDVRLVITDYILPYISGERLATPKPDHRPTETGTAGIGRSYARLPGTNGGGHRHPRR